MNVLEYQTANGQRPYQGWIRNLKDRQGVEIIHVRMARLRLGMFGDHRYVADGVWELRIFFGPGYRIYYLLDGDDLVILLCGGDKDSQNQDIDKAKTFAADYWRRK